MRVLLAGDSHGNADFIRYICKVATVNRCELIIQCGDFGLWPGPSGKKFLQRTNRLLVDARLELWFLDGNHDDHDQLAELSKRENFYTERQQVLDHIYYLPRGYRFELGGLRFMSLGGAWSIDKALRTPHVDWWPQEELTHGDYLRAVGEVSTPVDVLLTHDMPARIEAYAHLSTMSRGGDSNRQIVQAVAHKTHAQLHVHGHMHRAYTHRFDDGHVLVGLDCDQEPGVAWAVLDTEQQVLAAPFSELMKFNVHKRSEAPAS